MNEVRLILRDLRRSRRLSQSRLALRAGFDHSYVSRLESGGRRPTRPALERLARALELDASDRGELLRAGGFLPDENAELLAAWSRVPLHLRSRIMAVIEAVADNMEGEAA